MRKIYLFNNKQKGGERITHVKDRPIKSMIKAVTWRIIGSVDTFILSYVLITFFSKDPSHSAAKTAGSIAGVEVISKILLYYLHERAWEAIRWGRMMVVIRKNRRSISRFILREDYKSIKSN